MKRKKIYISWLLIVALLVHSPLCLAANDNQSVQSNREDHMEVEENFSSKKEWREHLKESNKNYQKDALDQAIRGRFCEAIRGRFCDWQ